MVANTPLLIIGLIFLILGFLVGVKKMTWLLSGFNEKRVKDKKKLSLIVGVTEMILGLILIILGILNFQYTDYAVLSSVAISIILVIYVNATMVDK